MSSSSSQNPNAHGSSPKRFKVGDQPTLPTSILKDAPPSEAETAQREERRKSRKSIGRRVSFAPTAHVRMFEIPEEKQRTPQGNNMFVMPDLSSQTGMAGFDLGTLPTIEETSMNSNESFDISVRHSDSADSIHSSEGSFMMDIQGDSTNTGSGTLPDAQTIAELQNQRYANILDDDDDDDDDDLEDNDDGDDDAVTMELTGTVDLGAINANDDSDDGDGEDNVHAGGANNDYGHIASIADSSTGGSTAILNGNDAANFLDMLLQSGGGGFQDTSLLDNIISQFSSLQQPNTLDPHITNLADNDTTRVGFVPEESSDGEDKENTIQVGGNTFTGSNMSGHLGHNNSNNDNSEDYGEGEEQDDEDEDEDEDEDGRDIDDAITMDLTGVVPKPLPNQSDANANEGGTSSDPATFGSSNQMQPGEFNDVAAEQQQPISTATPTRTPKRTPKKTPSSTARKTPASTPRTPANPPAQTQDSAASILAAVEQMFPNSPALEQLRSATPQQLTAIFQTPVRTASPQASAHSSKRSAAHSTPQPAALSKTPIGKVATSTPASGAVSLSSPMLASASPSSSMQTPSRRSSRSRRRSSSLHTAQVLSEDQGAESESQRMYVETTNGYSPLGFTPKNLAPESQPEPEPTFDLDSLPDIPALPRLPQPNYSSDNSAPSLSDMAKAGLVFRLFDAYSRQTLAPSVSEEQADAATTFPQKLEPLFKKAKLTARLEYCSSLSDLFEVDRDVSNIADGSPATFDKYREFFEEQNYLLEQHKQELLLRISKAKQKLSQDIASEGTGKLAGEIKELRARLTEIKRQREEERARIEQLNAEISSLQKTSNVFDREVTEKKSMQNILLAINGLRLSDAGESKCEFIYDNFAKLRLDATAEFTSLHPDVDWNAIVKDTIDASNLTMRQYVIAVMKTNALIKALLADIQAVRRHTFAELSYSSGLQVQIVFFSKELRKRFRLHIPLDTISSYTYLHEETKFDWPTDVTYGDVSAAKLKKCLKSCHIDSDSPLLSIYEHISQSMESL